MHRRRHQRFGKREGVERGLSELTAGHLGALELQSKTRIETDYLQKERPTWQL
jgi:hypothetical protein